MKTYKELFEKINSYKGVSKDGDMIFDLNKIASTPWEKSEVESLAKKYKGTLKKDLLYIPKEFKDDKNLEKDFLKFKFKIK